MPAHTYMEEICRGLQVSHQRWISRNMLHVRLSKAWINLPTVALEPRGDVTRSPKQGYQWLHKKDSCPPKIKKKIIDLTQWICPREQQQFQYNRINQSLHFKSKSVQSVTTMEDDKHEAYTETWFVIRCVSTTTIELPSEISPSVEQKSM